MENSAAAVENKRKRSGNAADRRKQDRFACSGFAEVVLEDAAFLFRGMIRDLSPTGCYIQSRARLMLAPGTTVELKFNMNCEELSLLARIAIVRPGAGAGFEFTEIDSETRSRLVSLIRKLENPGSEGAAIHRDEKLKGAAGSSSARDLWHHDR